ncbi:hypothetical protein [Neotamlana laminarinivorans]|uniref:Uncharacterized protein n=1 Tax=Neotamlana laminarinivorans TaxID=2883124 RepID=A0A9X1I2R0_9FLAO|nr:hypothetical protein [Tamlana laminarinivorans]MCB4800296.1 hypothetical protein [Tamlana laminarinivorans]
MEKVIFKEKAFEYSLIGYIILLLCWNFYGLSSGNFIAFLPIAIQGILLFLIFSKNKNAKIGIKIWAIILILSHGISFLAKLLKIGLGDEINLTEILNKAIFLIIGILIYSFNEKYVELIKTEK